MRAISVLMLAVFMIGVSGRSETALRSAISMAVRHKDAGSLKRLAADVSHSSPLVQFEYAAALYYINPGQAKKRFISAFPTDGSQVMSLLDILKGVPDVGSWYAYDTLGALANAGDASALRKLMLATAVADGGPAELLGSALAQVAKKRPAQVLSALSGLPDSARTNVSDNSYIWCQAGAATITKVITANATQRRVMGDLARALKTCQRRGR